MQGEEALKLLALFEHSDKNQRSHSRAYVEFFQCSYGDCGEENSDFILQAGH